MANLIPCPWTHRNSRSALCALLWVVLAGLAGPSGSIASSHSEAPLIAQDPAADNTDVYVFVSPGAGDRVTLIANYIPLIEPGDGPQFGSFDDEVLYAIHVDNDGDCLADITYEFNFSSELVDGLSYRFHFGQIDASSNNRNLIQTYSVDRVTSSGTINLITGAPTSPPNVGPQSNDDMEDTMLAAVQDAGDSRLWAGEADDPFFLDAGSIFDLLTVRVPPGNEGGGIDAFAGSNVMATAIEVPITDLTSNGEIPPGPGDPAGTLGIWSSASRRKITVRRFGGGHDLSGDFVQVSRLAMPLINEVMVPLGDRDDYNRRDPSTDFDLRFFLQFSDIPSLLADRLGTTTPFPPRDDIVDFVYHSNQTPAGCVGDVLRIDVGIPPSENPHRLGPAGGDAAGFPNGRRPLDDVTDVTLSVIVAGDPAAGIGDGVDYNDKPFLDEFPFLAAPHEGRSHGHGLPTP